MSGRLFFLSYAREDREDDPYQVIDNFYADLVRQVAGLLGRPEDEVGFFDTRSVQTGDEWPGAIEEALRTCRAFVPVLSPRYLTRPFCGKEWAAFRARMPAGSALIQPLLLRPRSYLKGPHEVTDINDSDDTLPLFYRQNGLNVLVRQGDKREYESLITAFATRLIAVTEKVPLEPAASIPPMASIKSAFHHDDAVTVRVSAGDREDGPRWASVILVAARRDEVAAVRSTVDAYGEFATEWRPWHPDIADEISYIVAEVALQQRLLVRKWDDAGDGLGQRIKEAFKRGNVVAVVADPWTLRLAQYRARVREVDEVGYMNLVVTILRNEADGETSAAANALADAVTLAFANRSALPNPATFLDSVSSKDDLCDRLGVALARAAARMREHLAVKRRAEGPGAEIVKPELPVPVGGSL